MTSLVSFSGLAEICESQRNVELVSELVQFMKISVLFFESFNFNLKEPQGPKIYIECTAALPIRILEKFLNIKHSTNIKVFKEFWT
jgi:hypothetical protein